MAGIINSKMADEQESGQEAAAEQQDPNAEASEDQQGDQSGNDSDNNPAFQQALKFAMSALYQSGAAQKVAESLRGAKDAPNALADTAYNIVTIADEKTNGAIPDDLLILFASKILEEVVDVATAAGVKVQPADIAVALKQMILRYLGEQGVDTSQLSAQMDKIDPNAFNKAAAAGL